MPNYFRHHLQRLEARQPAGELHTDDQKRRARSAAEIRATARRLADEEAAIDAFLENLTPEQRAEMERDCAGLPRA